MTSECVECGANGTIAKNRCWACYRYNLRTGRSRAEMLQSRNARNAERSLRSSPEHRRLKRVERFLNRVNKTNVCWLWTGPTSTGGHKGDGSGYGVAYFDSRGHYVHRLSYELHVGPIPDGLTIDHLCGVKACVNPAHLEPVTLQENIRRRGKPVIVV